jgi:hypothetical protein
MIAVASCSSESGHACSRYTTPALDLRSAALDRRYEDMSQSSVALAFTQSADKLCGVLLWLQRQVAHNKCTLLLSCSPKLSTHSCMPSPAEFARVTQPAQHLQFAATTKHCYLFNSHSEIGPQSNRPYSTCTSAQACNERLTDTRVCPMPCTDTHCVNTNAECARAGSMVHILCNEELRFARLL